MKVSLVYVWVIINLDESSDEENKEQKNKANTSILLDQLNPIVVTNDIIKCSQLYQKLGKINEAEKILLRGLECYSDSYLIKKELSDLYISQGDTKAAIKITGKKLRANKDEDSDSEYAPSDDEENDDNQDDESNCKYFFYDSF